MKGKNMVKGQVNVRFPNDNPIGMSVDVVKKWEISKETEIGDTVFFWADGVYVSMDKEEFNMVFKNKIGE